MRQVNYKFTLDVTYKEGVDHRACNRERKDGNDVTKYLNSKETSIYVSWSIGGKYYKQLTGERICAVEWDFDQNLPSKRYPRNRDVTARLVSIMSKIEKQYSNMRSNELPITPETVKSLVHNSINSTVEVSKEHLFWKAYEEFYNEKVLLCRPSTAMKYKSLQKVLKAFEKEKFLMSVEGVTMRWLIQFRLYCIGLGYLNNTTSKYIKMVKGFMQWAYDMKYHNNLDYKKFKLEFETTETIALTMEELKVIENFDPSGNRSMETALDYFMVGVFSAQRISDLIAMKKRDLNIQGDGEMWWDVHQIKGRKLVRVYMVAKARKILEKYLTGKMKDDFVFPRLASAVINRDLKKIGMESGIDTIVTRISYCGATKKEVTEPKYFFLSMHTARRTAISLMCYSNMPDHMIQNISGHSSSKEMMVYKAIDRVKMRQSLIDLFEQSSDIARSA